MSSSSPSPHVLDNDAAAAAPASLRDLITDIEGIPPTNASAEQCAYLRDVYVRLREALAARLADARAAVHSGDVSIEELRVFRDCMAALLVEDAETLGHGLDTHLVPGWTRLTAVWLVLAATNVLLAAEHARAAGHPIFALTAADVPSVAANALVVAPMPVLAYRTSELVAAYDVLRARLDTLVDADEGLVGYTTALEVRLSTLVACAHAASSGVADVDAYRVPAVADASVYVASRALVAASAWWVVVVRRALRNYFDPLVDVFFGAADRDAARALSARPVLPVHVFADDTRSPVLGSVRAFVLERARAYASTHHAESFKKTATQYTAAVGDVDAATAVRLDGTRVTWREAVTARASAAAAEYMAATRLERRSLASWVEALVLERGVGDGEWARPRPGPGTSWMIEQLAVLHTLRVYFNREYAPFDWGDTFVVMARAQSAYQENVLVGMTHGKPLLVQRLGRYGVALPLPAAKFASMRAFEAALAAVLQVPAAALAGVTHEGARGHMYECATLVDAFSLWLAALYVGFDSTLLPGRTATPLLRRLLLVDAATSRPAALTDAGPTTYRPLART